MIVFIKKKLVLLANPKTGSTAIQAALDPIADATFRNPPGLKHTNIQRYNRFYRKAFESHAQGPLETACLIREPIDWLGSWYRYRARPQIVGQPSATGHLSFEEFVLAYLGGTRPEFAKVGDQARFAMAKENTDQITHLFQYEQMDLFIDFLNDRLGTSIVLPRVNVSPLASVELSRATKAKLHKKCADQFDLWTSARR